MAQRKYVGLNSLAYFFGRLTATFAAIAHTHSASDITEGTLGVARGGTGATDAAAARTNLGVTAANVVNNQAIKPSSVTATGAVSGNSVSDSVGSLADLRDSVSHVVLNGIDALNLTRTSSGTCCLDFVVGSTKYRLQWRNDGIGYATCINGQWTTIWSK